MPAPLRLRAELRLGPRGPTAEQDVVVAIHAGSPSGNRFGWRRRMRAHAREPPCRFAREAGRRSMYPGAIVLLGPLPPPRWPPPRFVNATSARAPSAGTSPTSSRRRRVARACDDLEAPHSGVRARARARWRPAPTRCSRPCRRATRWASWPTRSGTSPPSATTRISATTSDGQAAAGAACCSRSGGSRRRGSTPSCSRCRSTTLRGWMDADRGARGLPLHDREPALGSRNTCSTRRASTCCRSRASSARRPTMPTRRCRRPTCVSRPSS